MKKRVLSIASGFIVATVIVTMGITLYTMHSASAEVNSGYDLAKACNTAPVTDGLGQVTLSTSLTIQNVSLTITTPCEIHLTNGASLIIHNSQLTTDKLVVLDDSSQPVSSPISIEHSTLHSSNGGLFIRLQHGGDNISVQHSTIDYPLSVSLATSDTDGTNQDGSIDVEATTIRSNDPASEGILLVSTGTGNFVNDIFSTTADDHYAILSAHSCHIANDSGTLPQCANQ
jgi:hypothetical protein